MSEVAKMEAPARGRGSLLRSTLALSSGRALAYAAGFFVPIILVRRMSPGEFGEYKQAFLLAETLFFIAQLGLATSLYYFVPRDPARSGRYVGNALVLLAAAAALVGIPLAFGGPLVDWLFSGSAVAGLVLPVAFYLGLMIVAAPLEIVMIARHRIRAASWSYALSDALRAGLLLLPALLTGELRYVLYGAIAFAAARVVATLLYVRRELGGGLALDASLARAQLAYSLPFALAVVLATAQLKLHELVVSHSFDAATYAIYAVGCLQIPFIDFVASPASDVMMVRMAEALGAGRPEEARASWFDAVSGLALLFVPLVGLLILCAPELIVLLFTPAYAASVPIFRLWSATILFVPLLTDPALRVYAETGFLAFANLIQLIVLALAIGPFLARFGLEGAVLATALAMLVGRAVALVRVRRRLGATGPVLPWRDLGLVALAAALALPIGWAAKAAAGKWALVALAAGAIAYGGAYLLLVWRFRLAPELAQLLRRALARFIPPASSATPASTEGRA